MDKLDEIVERFEKAIEDLTSYKNEYTARFKAEEAEHKRWRAEKIDEEENDSPYCEVCGHCGEIGCCGISTFLNKHIKGKTNCKNEDIILDQLTRIIEGEK